MEKIRAYPPAEKSRSFAGRSLAVDEPDDAADPGSAKSMGELDGRERVDLTSLGIAVGKFNLNEACHEIDTFVNGMSKDNPSEVDLPESVEVFLGLVEGLIDKYDCNQGEHSATLGHVDEEDIEFFEALNSLSKLTNALEKNKSHSTEMTATLNRANSGQQRAMAFLEQELRALLEKPKKHHDPEKTKKIKSVKASFKHQSHESDRCILPEANGTGSGEDVEFPGYSHGVVTSMNRIASAMISSGYQTQCSQVYSLARRSAFQEAQEKLKFEAISDDDLQRMPWESLEGEVSTWIRVVEKAATVHFPGERKLCDAVFTNYPHMWNELFSPLVESVGIRLLNFADSVTKTKRSPEKLFKFIDMYESIHDNFPKISSHFEPSEHAEKRMMGEVWGRKRSSELRQYHKSYQRETWGKVLVTLSHEGLQVNGKVNKLALKERFKAFNAMFDGIHKTQSAWVVSDTQMQSELRISVSSVVVPAYRSFLGRFGQHLDSGRQTEKYVKYQPDDIQNLIDELFDGNPNSMGRRR